MAQCEDVVRNSTMDAEVVYISDDDEGKDGPSSKATNKSRPKQNAHHYNVYENFEYVPPSVQAQLEYDSKKNKQERLQKLQEEISKGEEVVYVPDDTEEEDLLIGPVRKISHEIIFGTNLHPPIEFPYHLLKELEQHLTTSMINVSFTTEKNVWDNVLDQLALMRIAYKDFIDVCISPDHFTVQIRYKQFSHRARVIPVLI